MSNYTKTTNFGAKDTLPSGDSQKIIRGTEFDTEFNNVATAIATKLEVDGSNNLAISGTFSSTKLIPTGGTATGNGMYLPAANAVAISTNGTERLRIDSSGVASFASNPILNGGTANGLVYLDGSKVATSGSAVTFDGTNLATTGTASATKLIPTGGTATGNGLYLPAANTLALSTNGTERVRVDSSGNLGVGTASPGSRLDVQSASSANAYRVANIYNSAATGTTAGSNVLLRVASNGSGADSTLVLTDSTSTNGFISNNNGNLLFGNGLGFTERMRLDSSGNLGVGTTVGAASGTGLIIYSPTSTRLQLRNSTTGDTAGDGCGLLAFGSDLYVENRENGATLFFNNGSESARITSGGNFGVGSASPVEKLDVRGNIYGLRVGGAKLRLADQNNEVSIESSPVGVASDMVFKTSGLTRATLDSSGNLGLGVTPSAWNSGGNFQLASGKNISAGNGIGLYANGYFDGAWKYINSVGAAGYVQSANEHIWYTAPSGTAGNTITFYSALTLSGSDTSSLLTMGRGFLTQGTGYAGAGSSTADPYLFYTNNTERARITSGGQLCLGVTVANGSARFTVGGLTTGTSAADVFVGRTGTEADGVGLGASIQLQNNTNTTACIIQQYSNNLQFFNYTGAAWTERARIKSTGQFRFVPLSSDPSGAESGDVYYNSTSNKLKVYNGTSWVDLH